MRLIASHVVLTAGEFALAVFSSPCTIHGCRPISVRHQPKMHARNGKTTVTTPIQRNHFSFSSRRFQKRKAPMIDTSATIDPLYAIPRMLQ